MSWPDIQHSQMNTSDDVDISPPEVAGGAGHSMSPEGSTSAPYVQVTKNSVKLNYANALCAEIKKNAVQYRVLDPLGTRYEIYNTLASVRLRKIQFSL